MTIKKVAKWIMEYDDLYILTKLQTQSATEYGKTQPYVPDRKILYFLKTFSTHIVFKFLMHHSSCVHV